MRQTGHRGTTFSECVLFSFNENVLPLQLFSHGTAVGMRVHREARTPGLEDSVGNETFTMMLNDLFDALNIKLPYRGIKCHSKEIQVRPTFVDL